MCEGGAAGAWLVREGNAGVVGGGGGVEEGRSGDRVVG